MRMNSNQKAGACPARECNCLHCTAINFEERRSYSPEWKIPAQLYGAEALHYYFYQLQLQNGANAIKGWEAK